ncbi:MAG: glycosyl hydrolase 115 family protein [Terracidiphilus sp.]|jgi:hypothetical protein
MLIAALAIAQICHAISPPQAGDSSLQSADTAVRFTWARHAFALVAHGHAAPILVEAGSPATVRTVAGVFAEDVERVSGTRPTIIDSPIAGMRDEPVIVGVVGHSAILDRLKRTGKLDTRAIEGKWESALTIVVEHPLPGVRRALVIAGSDRRGMAFALFTLSRQMGVSPWYWWADVPVAQHDAVYVDAVLHVQHEPSVQYRGIFLNDEDWGLRPWSAKKMDPQLGNIGPHTYERIFELLLRLRANSLWPAMHPGTLAFNAVPENAKLADKWGIVMGSSHSEALLRNNVGEWDEKRDGPWNYQVNRAAIDAYWDKRVRENGGYENFYTVGMRGVHDSGLEATGTAEEKARLVEAAMRSQRQILAAHVDKDVAKIPQVVWLYKESLELYRAGMKVPGDVTLGWTDDNYGYLRQLPTVAEQQRPGGSGIYYHVSYWGSPHDYLWLCSTPPALIREEMMKAYDHNARRYWVLNVGDLKPAEIDIDYFMQLAWDEPRVSNMDQKSFLDHWFAEQFSSSQADEMAGIITRYYQLNFVRKPEFMGFNGHEDGINRTAFNPLAWGDQNRTRLSQWQQLRDDAIALAKRVKADDRDAYFELVGYPVEAAAEQNAKFLFTDHSYLDAHLHEDPSSDAAMAQAAYDRIQSLTAEYNSLDGSKWDGMMSAAPRDRQVFLMPRMATAADVPLSASWAAGDEATQTISINATHFTRKSDGELSKWNILPELGISGASVVYGEPGLPGFASVNSGAADAPWLEYVLPVAKEGNATLTLHLLPTFAIDSQHRLRYAIALDGATPVEMDASGSGEWHENSAPAWAENVLRNSALAKLPLGRLMAGTHKLRLIYRDPGVVFEHIVVSFDGAAPAYPVPPEN